MAENNNSPKYDTDKVDEMALALLYLTYTPEDSRAWKDLAWEITNRLHEKGWIEDPRNKNRSVVLTREGRVRCVQLFKQHFALPSEEYEGDNKKPDVLPIAISQLRFLMSVTDRLPFCLDRESGDLCPISSLSSDDEDNANRIPDELIGTRYLRIPTAKELTGKEWLDEKQAKRMARQWLAENGIQPE